MQSEKVKFILHWGRKKKRFLCHRNNLKNKIAKRLDIATKFSLEVLKKESKEWVPVTPSDLCNMDEVRVANLHKLLKSEGEVNGVSAGDDNDDYDSSSEEELCDSLREKLKENIALDAAEKRFLCDLLWCRPKSMWDYKSRKMENKSTQTEEGEGEISEHQEESQREMGDKKEKEVETSERREREEKVIASEKEDEEEETEVVGKKKHNENKDDDDKADGKEKQDKEEAKKNDESKDILGKPKSPYKSLGNSKMGISNIASLFSSDPVNFGELEEMSEDEKGDGSFSSDSELKTKSDSPGKKDEDDQKTTGEGTFSSASGSEVFTEMRSENCPNEEKPDELATPSDAGNKNVPDLRNKETEDEEKETAEMNESSDAGADCQPLKSDDSDKESSESVLPQLSLLTPHLSPDTDMKKHKERPSIRIKSPSSPGRQSVASDQLRSPGSKKRKKGEDSFSDAVADDDSLGKRKSARNCSKSPKTTDRDSSDPSNKAKVDISSPKRKSTTNRSSRGEVPSEKSVTVGEGNSEPPGKKRKSEGKKKKKEDAAKMSKKSAYKQVKEMRERMIAELKKDSPDDDEIRKLMDETFKARQDYILNDMPRIKVVRETYPALFNVKEVVREFNRIKEEDCFEKYKKNLKAYAAIVLENASSTSSSPVVDIVKEKLNEDLSDEEKDYVKSAAVILLLATYLKEDVRKVISFVKVTKSVFPLITCNVPLEKVLSSDARFTILVEMNKLCTSASLVEAFFAFISSFYIFNIEFPEECIQTIAVIESLFLEMESEVSLSEEAKNVQTSFRCKVKENERHAVDAKEDESCEKMNESSKQNGDEDDEKGEEKESSGFSSHDEDRNSDVREQSTERKNDSDEGEKDDSESGDH